MNLQFTSVRLSFPALFKARSMEKDKEPKFSAAFILDKKAHAKQIEALKAAIQTVAEEKWGKGKIPKNMKPCLRDGSEKDTDGYGEDVVFFSANSVKRVPVVDRNLTPLTEQDGKPYAGCYVNVSIRLWAQDNDFGKRVNAQLRAVQFVKDGEAFGDKPADPNKEFAALPDEEESDTSLL